MGSLPLWITSGVIAVTFLALLPLEFVKPLRREVESKARRIVRNLALGGVSAAVIAVLQAPFLVPLAGWAERAQVGLLNRVAWPPLLEAVAGILLLDYTLWHWHRWNHLVPFLWRFHLVHHVDRDLDASTALRFHFGEMALSVPYRMLQVTAIGASPLALGVWHVLLFVSILFHHSNVRLPLGWERVLVKLVVTPRMHGIHHSDREAETNSNWSSLFSAWDYLHRTLLLDVPQGRIVIGVPAYRDEEDVRLGQILTLPFRSQRDDWRRGGKAEAEPKAARSSSAELAP